MDTGYGRPVSAGYKAVRFGRRAFLRRAWLKCVRLYAVAYALASSPERVTDQIMESARMFCELLDETPVPEPVGGITGRAVRLFREKISHGIRYPEYRGRARVTFWQRLYVWVRRAADSPKGAEALDLAGSQRSPHRSHTFAMRVMGHTLGLLLTPVASTGQDSFRYEMSDEVNHGLTDDQRRERYRVFHIIIRAVVAGVTTVAVSDLGLGKEFVDSLGLGVLLAAATGVTDATIGGLGGLTPSMLAARRQARDWLMTLSALLTQYVTWTNESVRANQGGAGVERLVYLLSALSARDAELKGLQPNDEILLRGLQQVLGTAERAQDHQLQGTLIDLQTAILYRPNIVPDAINRLLSLVQGVPDADGPSIVGTFEISGNQQALPEVQCRELPDVAEDHDEVEDREEPRRERS